MLNYQETYGIPTTPLLEESDGDTYSDNDQIKEDGDFLIKFNQPVDKYNFTYLIFYLLGVTTLMPWNFFITADNYWMYKFRDPNAKLTHPNITLNLSKRTPLQAEFTSYLNVASNIPTIAFLALNVLLSKKISLQSRMVGSLTCMLLLFIITTIFVQINTDSWELQFFTVTIIIVVLLNVASAILAGSIFGIIGRFSPKYITAVVGGQALGGIFAALAQIISLAIGASSVHSAFFYFMIANFMIVVSLISYITLSNSVFFKYYISENGVTETEHSLIGPVNHVSHRNILRKIWAHGISILLVFMITLSVYPGITVLIESKNKGKGSKWNDIYFVPVVAYLLFSCGDYFGRLTAGYFQRPTRSSILIVSNLLRIGFIPFLLVCNAQPRHNLPVLINEDYYYIILICLFSFSNGYFANLSVIATSRIVDDNEKEGASSMIAVFVGLGLTLGSAINLVFIKLL